MPCGLMSTALTPPMLTVSSARAGADAEQVVAEEGREEIGEAGEVEVPGLEAAAAQAGALLPFAGHKSSHQGRVRRSLKIVRLSGCEARWSEFSGEDRWRKARFPWSP